MIARVRRRGLGTVAVLVVCIVAVVLLAVDAQRSAPAGRPVPRAGAAIALPEDVTPAAVSVTAPRRLRGDVTVRAQVRPAGQRIVAVTFLLDGRPLGTDTTRPFALDVDASQLQAGAHRLRAEAVDRVGRRASSSPVRVWSAAAHTAVWTPGEMDAALRALARGHVTVRLGPGRYQVPHVELGSGARLIGAGRTTILSATSAGWSLVTARGHGVRIANLTIDGAGREDRGIGVAAGSNDVRLQRLLIRGIRETGVEIWGTHSDVSVQDSVITGERATGAGVADLGSDDSRDTSVIRSDISGFSGYGITFVQRAYDRPAAAAHALALDNRISQINDPAAADGTHEGGIWSGGVAAAIIGNRVRDTGWDGIQTVGSSRGVTVVDNDVARTRVGIYLEHETNDSLFAGNRIADVATGINVEWRYEGAGSSGNTFARNAIERPTDAGIFVDVAGDRNRLVDNVVTGGSGPAIVLQGASDNVVAGTAACARGGERVVVQQSAHYDNGQPAHSLRNRVDAAGSRTACPAG
jgi:Right handed beta helix region/Bacterial Ig domain